MICPQTNLQLYQNLQKNHYSETEMCRVRRAYEIAIHLFAGWFRGSGKPFINHLVGTAGILSSLGAPGPVVAAGLLHAAYSLGEYSNHTQPWWDLNREKVERAVGEECEDLILRYTRLDWTPAIICSLSETASSLSTKENEVVLVRLANELEDHQDCGILYCRNATDRRQLIKQTLCSCADLAVQIGQPELARALQNAFDQVMAVEVPSYLQTGHDISFRISTQQDEPRVSKVVKRLAHAWLVMKSTLGKKIDHSPGEAS